MIRRGAALVGVVLLLTGCTYYNTVYNAQRTFDQAETDRIEGRDSLAQAGYRQVIQRTADAYRGAPPDARPAEALLMLGRARLRVGEPRAARAALEEAAALAARPELRVEALAYLAVARSRMGEKAAALAAVEAALEGGVRGRARAEAYMLRSALRLEAGQRDAGWTDLDRAAAADPRLAGEVAIERVRLGVLARDRTRVAEGFERVFATDLAAERLTSVIARILEAEAAWGPSATAGFLAGADTSTWSRQARGRIGLERARLLHAAGEDEAATDQARSVARERGEAAAEARLLLARWHLASSNDLGEAHEVVPILLPAVQNEEVADLLDAVATMDRYAGMGLDAPLGWFLAGEVARDRLGAPVLARGLFMAYADTDPSDPWAAKALLAALDASPDEVDQAWIRGRLEAHRHSPYVLAAFGGDVEGLEELEEALRVRLSEIRGG